MKKLNIIIAALAMSGAAFAQTTAKDSIAAVKAAEKAAKIEKAAQEKAAKAAKAQALKDFKAKQAADLKAFIEAQNGNGKIGTPEVKLVSHDDSVAHLFGIAQSNGLKQYVVGQLNVDTTYLDRFVSGVLDRVNIDPTDKALAAYNAGANIGGQVVNMADQFSNDYYSADPGMKVNPTIVGHGLICGLLGTGELSAEEAGPKFRDIIAKRQEANKEKAYGPNREAGKQFLAENAKKEGVVVLPSGLQYKVITEGTGEKPKATDKVKVHYEGTLIDGTVFDSSIKRGTPSSFQVTQVIKGWTEALQLMPVGSKWELYIPYDLAYGDRETGKEIKPYSTLIFNVELLDIEKAAEKKTTGSDDADIKEVQNSVKEKIAAAKAKREAAKKAAANKK